MRRALLAALAFAAAACEPGHVTEAPGVACTEAGVQCALPDGPLGVCERTTCAADATPPCFVCAPQH